VIITAGLAVAGFRATPFAAWCALSSRPSRPGKAASLAAYAALIFALWRLSPETTAELAWVPLGLIYFGFLAAGIWWARPLLSGSLGTFLLVLGLPIVFFVIPARTFLTVDLRITAIMGWEMAFAAYSYCSSNESRSATLRQAMFFLLIDPSLVYRDRAQPGRRRPGWSARRVLGGAVLVSLQQVLVGLLVLTPLLDPLDLLRVDSLPGYARFVFGHLAVALGLYWSHAGLASLQIGFLGLAGFTVMERYDHPYAATSPADFWRRWNVWMSRWAYLYIFVPTARAIATPLNRKSRGAAIGIAVLATFATVGLLHDMVPWVLQSASPRQPVLTIVFLVAGTMVLSWHAAERVWLSRFSQSPVWIRRVAMLHVAAIFLWVAVPALSARHLPAKIHDAVFESSVRGTR